MCKESVLSPPQGLPVQCLGSWRPRLWVPAHHSEPEQAPDMDPPSPPCPLGEVHRVGAGILSGGMTGLPPFGPCWGFLPQMQTWSCHLPAWDVRWLLVDRSIKPALCSSAQADHRLSLPAPSAAWAESTQTSHPSAGPSALPWGCSSCSLPAAPPRPHLSAKLLLPQGSARTAPLWGSRRPRPGQLSTVPFSGLQGGRLSHCRVVATEATRLHV